jgi:hypothetical protein
MERRRTADVGADGARPVELAVTTRIRDDREQFGGGRMNLDRTAHLVRSGINGGDRHDCALLGDPPLDPPCENTSSEPDFVDVRWKLVLCVPPLIPSLKPLLKLEKAEAGQRAPDEQACHQ